ncbi:hypothetical protein V6N11_028654 [Hibiscus sabdariffa]|uniref:S-protein homolog n=1 Tax=Hibiscus sabdariffa TaxID=183260 RepID=A0ABR2PQP4_9ROSI
MLKVLLFTMKHARSKVHSGPFVHIHPLPNQDNAPPIPIDHVPNQDSTQRSIKRQSRSALPAESLVNCVVSEKQLPNGWFDKHYYTHKELKFVCRSKMEVSRVLIWNRIDGNRGSIVLTWNRMGENGGSSVLIWNMVDREKRDHGFDLEHE